MLKKLGISTLAVAALLMFANPAPAKAGVRFGFSVGTPPVYAYPAPYAYPHNYYAPPPAYVYPTVPSYGYGFNYWNGGHGYDRREHFDHRNRGFREHDGRGHDHDHRR